MLSALQHVHFFYHYSNSAFCYEVKNKKDIKKTCLINNNFMYQKSASQNTLNIIKVNQFIIF